ncbi:Peptidyl-prolyl cis-trans isomerase FKBP16-3, chloroplastic [Galdieria sulphuraria]|nr:Peptidyl-prolyl cis-trans isomerase FKBP16-3, chloroplastic [Galdieria sulphuraria]
MMGLKLVKFCSFVNLYCSFRNSETQKLFRERRAQHSCQRQKPSFSYYYGHKILLAYSVVLPNNLLAQKILESVPVIVRHGETCTYDDKQPFAFRHGGRRRMVIPGSLAYSVAGLGPIPPSTSVRRKLADSLKQGNVLSLDVELLKIWKDPVGMEYYSDFVPDVSKIPRSIFLKK